jgi:uncharacterized protein YecE (DUF72 family)
VTTPQLLVGTSGWSHADWVGPFYPAGTAPRDYLSFECRDFGATDFAHIRLLGERSAVPDDFSHVRHVRIDRDRELALWAERIRGYLARGVSVFVFVNNHYQGNGPATARAFLSRLAVPVPVP